MLEIIKAHCVDWLLIAMQISIVVPMMVVWLRRRHFAAPVRLLSWYVYLSAFSVIGARLGAAYLHNNLPFLIGFNVGKIVLFAAVYSQVLAPLRVRWLWWATGFVLVAQAGITASNWVLAVDTARVAQCTLLAGFALLYLEQTLTQTSVSRSFRDPLWLLSVGQLVYSAGTVTAFSLGMMHTSGLISAVIYVCISVSGLAFNYFLTLAFLRAQTGQPVAANTAHTNSDYQAVGFINS